MKEALSRFKDTVKGEIRKALKVLRNDEDMEEIDSSKKDLANQEKMPGGIGFKEGRILSGDDGERDGV